MPNFKRASLARSLAGLAGFLGLLLVAACAGQTQTGSLDRARTAISAAEQNQAAIYAPLEYETAQVKLRAAEEADAPGEAEMLADEAIATAQLAQARSIATLQSAQMVPPSAAQPQLGAAPQDMGTAQQGAAGNQILGPPPSGEISQAPAPYIMPPLQ